MSSKRRPKSAELIGLARPEDLTREALDELVAQVRKPADTGHPSAAEDDPDLDLVYFAEPVDSHLVFAVRWEAEGFAALRSAILQAKTWRALAQSVPDWALAYAIEALPSDNWTSFDSFLADNGAADADDATKDALLDEWLEDLAPGIERDPLDWEKFDAARDYLVGLMGEGTTWPTWLKAAMLDWVPVDIAKQFGTTEHSALDGPYLRLDASDEHAIVQALTDAGHTCSRDDKLMGKATGWE